MMMVGTIVIRQERKKQMSYEQNEERAGQKYRPSNGTEGDMFMESFCDRCQHDDLENDMPCQIIAKTFYLDVDDEDYPEEWQYAAGGQPTCTKYELRSEQ